MRLRLFDCFRSPSYHSNGCEVPQPVPVLQLAAAASNPRPSIGGPGPTTPEALEQIQVALLNISGSWFACAAGLLAALEEQGVVAVLYGVIEFTNDDPDFVVLSLDKANLFDVLDSERRTLLRSMYAAQAPITQQLTVSSSVTKHQHHQRKRHSTQRTAAAVPLRHGRKLIGALLLEDSGSQARPNPHPETPTKQNSLPRNPGLPTGSTAQPSQPTPAQLLLQNNDALRQLAFTASICLAGPASQASPAAAPGAGHRQVGINCSSPSHPTYTTTPSAPPASEATSMLAWLSAVMGRLRSAPSMSALTAVLCSAVTAHVRRAFVLEAITSAALVPPPGPEASLALLFRVQGGAGGPHGGLQGQQGAGGAAGVGDCGDSGEVADVEVAVGAGAGMGSQNAAVTLGGGAAGAGAGGFGGAGGGSMRCRRQSSLLSRMSQMGPPAVPAMPAAPNSATNFSFRAVPAQDDANGVLRSISRLFARGSHADPLTRPPTGSNRHPDGAPIVIPLSAAKAASFSAASFTSPTLHACAFPLQNTLLQAVLEERLTRLQEQEQQLLQSSHEEPFGSLPGSAAAVVEDTLTFVQNVHNTSRDVCLIMGSRGVSMRGALGGNSNRSFAAGGGAVNSAAAASVSGSGSGALCASAPQSLVLLVLGLDEGAAVGLYLCFPRRLPGSLLEAVRHSSQELIDQAFGALVRERLRTSLAAEYETLKSASPGSYAVVRGLNPAEELLAAAAAAGGSSGAAGGGAGGNVLSASPPVGYGPVGRIASVDSFWRRKSMVMLHRTSGNSLYSTVDGNDCGGGGGGTAAMHVPHQRKVTPAMVERLRSFAMIRRASMSYDSGNRFPSSRNMMDRAAAAAAASASVGGGGGAGAAFATTTSAGGDDVLDLLLNSFNNEAASLMGTGGGGAGGGGGGLVPDGRSASIITVMGAEPCSTTARQQMDLLVSSLQTTLRASVAGYGASAAFAGDLEHLELVEVLGKGGGGVVLKGQLNGSLHVAVKLMEFPEEEDDEDSRDSSAAQQPDPTAANGNGNGHPRRQQQQQTPAGQPGVKKRAAASKQLKTRRELLRNAMELTVQSALSHPNIVQFYSTFNNVVLRCRQSSSSSNAQNGGGGGAGGGGGCAVGSQVLATDPRSLYLQVVPHSEPLGDDEARVTCILAEYCDAGSLGAALQGRTFPRLARTPLIPTGPGRLPFVYDMKCVYMTLLDVALALRHLHSLNLVHRDVKPANLLLKSNPRDHRGFTVKLADFGFVLNLTETADDGTPCATVDQACGTVTHMAPECMPGKARIDASVDIYSFGILMWELLAGGDRPFPSVHPDKIPRLVYKGARPSFADNVPLSYQNLAKMCWRTNPSRRPRAADIVGSIAAQLQAL